jgi:hypothetical protein
VNPTAHRSALTLPASLPPRTVRLFDLDPGDVADWLEQVTPHLDTDGWLPFLTAVHIRLAAGHVHAYATDRYTGAIATLPYVSTDQDARFTIPGDFARRAIDWLRGEDLDPEEDGEQTGVDITIGQQLFGLTMHLRRRVYWENDKGGYEYGLEHHTARMAARIDPDGEVLDFPRFAAAALAEPEATGPVHVNTNLLTRFLGYGPTVPFDPGTGHLLAHGGDLLAGYRVYNTGRVIVLTRAHYLGIIATCRGEATPEAARREMSEASTREAWRTNLAAIA